MLCLIRVRVVEDSVFFPCADRSRAFNDKSNRSLLVRIICSVLRPSDARSTVSGESVRSVERNTWKLRPKSFSGRASSIGGYLLIGMEALECKSYIRFTAA